MTPRRRIAEPQMFYLLVALGAIMVALGLGGAYELEEQGHAITGMDNQVVWGVPHVFAIVMIVAASGVLNVATIGSVFGQAAYKARAPLSGLLSLTLLAGGLTVLMLDLGRPDRIVVASTHFNFTSVFAWNVFLYSGLCIVVAAYLWTLMERRMNPWSTTVGLAALGWRFALTTGTGSIFGLLVARQAYQSAILAPMFIILSLSWGLAVFLVVQAVMYAWNGERLPPPVQSRMARLLGVFVGAVAYFVFVYHLTNLYYARQAAFERFILLDGPVFPAAFWIGFVAIGTIVPLLLLLHPRLGGPRSTMAASLLVLAGAGALLYVFIIGGQAFPLDLFPGYLASSSFGDGAVAHYVPSLPEISLGIGGIGVAFLATTIGVRALHFLPRDDFDH
jgi:Ni/Fe-hydrogenase subunit HybB-like protein